MKESIIKHSGILGMKWGIHKYQDEHGNLTEAGKARYNEDGTKKNPAKMSSEDLKNSTNRLSSESQYATLTGRSQPSHSFNRDNAIKIGAAFIASAGASLLARKLRSGKWLEGGSNTPTKKRIGKTVVTAMLAGSLGALVVGSSTVGGSVYNTTPAPKAADSK